MIGCDYGCGTFMGHVWTPTKNDVFQYQKTIVPSTWTQIIKNFQLQKIISTTSSSLIDSIASPKWK
jgi:hypothetical protein